MDCWTLYKNKYDESTHLHDAPINSLGNGLLGCRGFFEEQPQGIAALGGIYMAGAFGAAEGRPCELVNIPNFFCVRIRVNGCLLVPQQEKMQDFETALDLHNGTLTRSYIYTDGKNPLVHLKFFRFLDTNNIFAACQHVEILPLAENLNVEVEFPIDTTVSNLNAVSCEPHPVQPGRHFFADTVQKADMAYVRIIGPDDIRLAFAQRVEYTHACPVELDNAKCFRVTASCGEAAVFKRQIAIAASHEDGEEVEAAASARLQELPPPEQQLQQHCLVLHSMWEDADVQIDGDEESQLSMRYNIYQLMMSCPEHDERYSIGARGLTGEMYEGCIFWDTELFMLPFFTCVRPQAARRLLAYRYHTLEQARKNAKRHFFEGAMYGWQVDHRGVEQTPDGVGAFYAIHVIADIAFAILRYWNSTHDTDFMLRQGLEILLETSRFWASRVDKRPNGAYDILAVRGPNEYDVVVNNNLYTNMIARENMALCRRMVEFFEDTAPAELELVLKKTGIEKIEMDTWRQIEKGLILPYDEAMDLWLEDETYLRRRPLNVKTAKVNGKRIIDSTIPYEALPLYQVTKQSDVLLLMQLLPQYFTKKQQEIAYDYYMPRTAFDSSLSYSTAAVMAARLGRMDTAADYFKRTVNLDLHNVQLNTISGLHYANFGGSWQVAVFGFGGVSIDSNGITVEPHLPDGWNSLTFRMYQNGTRVQFTVTRDRVEAVWLEGKASVSLNLCGKSCTVSAQCPTAHSV